MTGMRRPTERSEPKPTGRTGRWRNRQSPSRWSQKTSKTSPDGAGRRMTLCARGRGPYLVGPRPAACYLLSERPHGRGRAPTALRPGNRGFPELAKPSRVPPQVPMVSVNAFPLPFSDWMYSFEQSQETGCCRRGGGPAPAVITPPRPSEAGVSLVLAELVLGCLAGVRDVDRGVAGARARWR